MFLKLLFLTLIIIAIAFAALGIRMFLIKGGEFKRRCANADNEDVGCICGGKGGENCRNCKNNKEILYK